MLPGLNAIMGPTGSGKTTSVYYNNINIIIFYLIAC